jgi:taurine dioxygenase
VRKYPKASWRSWGYFSTVINIEHMNFRLLSPFGVEAKGMSITDLGDRDIDAVKNALANNGFVVFRNQSANDADFVAFLARLGSLTFTIGEIPVSHQPDLNIVSNIGRTKPPRSVFHTDTSYVAHPPAFTGLRAVTVPVPDGGTFFFSDQYLAYETLPSSVKEQLADAQVLHVVSGLTLAADVESQCWHPLFKRHPISGRLSLFLSTPERCQAISGIPSAAAGRIIRLLYQHSLRHYRLYCHQWQPDDILVWDNRCTLHRADLAQFSGDWATSALRDRVLHRGLVLEKSA